MEDGRDSGSDRIEDLLEQLCDLDAAGRSQLLDQVCAGDPELRSQVDRLLESYDSAMKFVEQFPGVGRLASTAHPDRTFADGEIVAARFRIRRLLGHGGVGEVYEAEDLELHEAVALKTVLARLAADETLMERLTQELRLARKIGHPNVCRVYDVYQHRTAAGTRVPLFAMELLEGETLAQRLRQGPMAPHQALPLVAQIAEAIDAAHASSVAHGDLKPGNVMLVSTDGPTRVVVTDFGLARWLPPGSTLVAATTESRRWGTPTYMAPEQLLGGRITRASDIYALGVMCYEMVTGQQPFAGEAPMLLAVSKLRRQPRLPRDLVPDLDPRWQSAILRCLDVDPARRFRVAKDVVAAIEGKPRRKPWMIAAAAAAAIAIAWTGTKIIEPGAAISTSVARRAASERIVAILPISADTSAEESDVFTLGLTAALSDLLHSMISGQTGLHIIPSEEAINTGVRTPALAQHVLGATLFVGARVIEAGDRTELVIGLNEVSNQGFRLKDSRRVTVPSAEGGLLEKVADAAIELLDVDDAVTRQKRPSVARTREAEHSYLLGRGHLARGAADLPAAIAAFQRAIQIDGQFADAHAGLSEAYRLRYDATRVPDDLRLARESIDRAISIAPATARAHVIRGRLYLASSQYQRAAAELTTALKLDPDVPDGRRLLAAAHQGNGAIEMAEMILREAVARHPRHWSGHVQLGNFLYRQGRYREAEDSLVQASTRAPDNQTVMLSLSAVYLAQERFTAAESELVKAIKVAPDSLLYNNLAWVYILEGRFGEAVTTMEAAVKLPRADSLVWSSLARAYRWAGRKNWAQSAYMGALERADQEVRVDPSNAGVRGNRASLLVEAGRASEGLREIEAAVALDSAKANVIVFFHSAVVHEWVGKRERALQDLVLAARLGYSKGVIERHPDLARLRKDAGYRRVFEMAGTSTR